MHTQAESIPYTPLHFPSHAVPPPGVTVTSVTSSQVVYETTAHGSATRVIAGYEVIRFGVPMIGEYENTGRGRRVTISPAVPGAQYRITAWALGGGNRSATPAVVYATTGEEGELSAFPRPGNCAQMYRHTIQSNACMQVYFIACTYSSTPLTSRVVYNVRVHLEGASAPTVRRYYCSVYSCRH